MPVSAMLSRPAGGAAARRAEASGPEAPLPLHPLHLAVEARGSGGRRPAGESLPAWAAVPQSLGGGAGVPTSAPGGCPSWAASTGE
ncbi:MAG: hypothetical protein ACLRWQ_03650 [Flavonifractor plautii]